MYLYNRRPRNFREIEKLCDFTDYLDFVPDSDRWDVVRENKNAVGRLGVTVAARLQEKAVRCQRRHDARDGDARTNQRACSTGSLDLVNLGHYRATVKL